MNHNTLENAAELGKLLMTMISSDIGQEEKIHSISRLIHSYTNQCIMSVRIPDIILNHHIEIFAPDVSNKNYRCYLINNSNIAIRHYGDGQTIKDAVTAATFSSSPYNSQF